MRPRIPLAYAGLLIIALVAVVGFAAFSPSSTTDESATDTTPDAIIISSPTSARVASAVLALRVSDADSRTATTDTTAVSEPTTAASTTSDASTSTTATTEEDTGTTEEPSTTQAAAAADDEPAAAPAPAADTTPPAIKVTSPKDGAKLDDRIVTFKGTTEVGASVTNGPYSATVSDDGTWTMNLVLAEGANGASFTATDAAGNTSSTRIVVHRTVTAATTTTKAPSKPKTTTTTKPATTVTTPSSKWSPNWPADSGGSRNVESWRSTVAQYWPAARVDCVLGIIKRESNGNPRAYNSGSNAEGLMQHLGKYWVSRAKGAGFVDGNGLVASPFNGAANIAAGAYLANYYSNSIGQWWNPWKSGSSFTAQYGSCQSSNPS